MRSPRFFTSVHFTTVVAIPCHPGRLHQATVFPTPARPTRYPGQSRTVPDTFPDNMQTSLIVSARCPRKPWLSFLPTSAHSSAPSRTVIEDSNGGDTRKGSRQALHQAHPSRAHEIRHRVDLLECGQDLALLARTEHQCVPPHRYAPSSNFRQGPHKVAHRKAVQLLTSETAFASANKLMWSCELLQPTHNLAIAPATPTAARLPLFRRSAQRGVRPQRRAVPPARGRSDSRSETSATCSEADPTRSTITCSPPFATLSPSLEQASLTRSSLGGRQCCARQLSLYTVAKGQGDRQTEAEAVGLLPAAPGRCPLTLAAIDKGIASPDSQIAAEKGDVLRALRYRKQRGHHDLAEDIRAAGLPPALTPSARSVFFFFLTSSFYVCVILRTNIDLWSSLRAKKTW